MGYGAAPGDEDPDLLAKLGREFGKVSRQLMRDDPVRRDPPPINFLEGGKIAFFQSRCMSVDGAYMLIPPK